MRIGVNLIPIRPGQVGGAEYLARDLLDALLASDNNIHLVLVTAAWNHDTFKYPATRVTRVLLRSTLSGNTANEHGGWLHRTAKRLVPQAALRALSRSVGADELGAVIKDHSIDLWFCPMTHLDPPRLAIPSVITVHDLQHEYYPEFFSTAELQQRAGYYRSSCESATAVVADSEYTRRCILEKYRKRCMWSTPRSGSGSADQ